MWGDMINQMRILLPVFFFFLSTSESSSSVAVVIVGVRYIIKGATQVLHNCTIGPAPFTAFLFSHCKQKPTRPTHTPKAMHVTALRCIARRGLATAAAHPPPHAAAAASTSTTTTVSSASAIPLSNVEAQWSMLSSSEQAAVHQQLEALQQKDWKTLSLAEKKAGACLLFAHIRVGAMLVLIGWLRSVLCCFWTTWSSCSG